VTLNCHGAIDVCGHASTSIANNLRLYEATGVGTCLVTDWKENLPELFEPGQEVVAYRSIEECIEKVRHLLSHESERARIAAAGQARTLREHTYQRRMEELLTILERRFCASARAISGGCTISRKT
jgi:spore maturation protein CgeB